MKLRLLLLSVALGAPLAQGQTLIYELKPQSQPNGDPLDFTFGTTLARVGDIDQDGVADLAIASFGKQGSAPVPDRLRVISAVSGGDLWAATRPAQQRFGSAIVGLGDLDGDGYDELAVGAPGDGGPGNGGRVYVLSGVDGSELAVWPFGVFGGSFGFSLAALDDLDGDGFDEVAIGAPMAFSSGQLRGVVVVLSGATGVELYHIEGVEKDELYGRSLAALGDVDLDGYVDFAVGAPFWDGGLANAGRFEVRSGASGALLFEVQGQASSGLAGYLLAPAGDVDLDGAADVVAFLEDGLSRVFSGATGAQLHDIAGPAFKAGGLANLGDVDGDGIDDLAVRFFTFGTPVALVSGADGALFGTLAYPPTGTGTVVGAGDVNLDGRGDLLVSDNGIAPFGSARLYSGVAATPPGIVTCSGDASSVPCPCQGGQVYAESFDGGALPAGWTATGAWHVTTACAGCAGSDPYAYFGDDATCNYITAPVNNSMFSPWIQLPSQSQGKLVLEFCHSVDMDVEGNRAWVYVHGEDGTTLAYYSGQSLAVPYDPQPYDITQYLGQRVQIEWYFFNDFIGVFGGWRVDDVAIRWLPNNGVSGQGCLNSSGAGAQLRAVGSTSVAADDLLLSATHLPTQSPALFVAGDLALQQPVPLFGGLLCTGGTVQRFAAESSGPLGTLSLASPISASNGLIHAGRTYSFQAWFRDPGSVAPCGLTSNLSNAVLVTFAP